MVDNISAKKIQNPLKNDKVMEWTRKKYPFFLTFDLCGLDLGGADVVLVHDNV